MWVKPIHISIFDNLQLEQEEGTLKTPVLFDQQIYKVRGFSTTNTNAWKPLKHIIDGIRAQESIVGIYTLMSATA
jgi:hypothetical protein